MFKKSSCIERFNLLTVCLFIGPTKYCLLAHFLETPCQCKFYNYHSFLMKGKSHKVKDPSAQLPGKFNAQNKRLSIKTISKLIIHWCITLCILSGDGNLTFVLTSLCKYLTVRQIMFFNICEHSDGIILKNKHKYLQFIVLPK